VPITLAGRFPPLGPLGMSHFADLSAFWAVLMVIVTARSFPYFPLSIATEVRSRGSEANPA